MKYNDIYKSANRIHQNIIFKEGKKVFPTEDIIKKEYFIVNKYSNINPLLSIVIPCYFRFEHLFELLNKILASNITFSYEIIIYNNSFLVSTNDIISKYIKNTNFLKTKYCVGITLVYDPNSNFPTIRNNAYNLYVNKNSKIISFWDCDIFPQKNTIKRIVDTLVSEDEIKGLAPLLIGEDNSRFISNPDVIGMQKYYQMPGSVGLDIGTFYSKKILLTGIMRGCFFLKKEAIEEHKKMFGYIFPREFNVWSNMPFFAGLRELNLRYGYLFEHEASVIHMDKVKTFTLGKDLNNRILENLKYMTQICLRNQLFIEENKKINSAYVKYTTNYISYILNLAEEEANKIMTGCIEIARSIYNEVEYTPKTELTEDLYKYIIQYTCIKEIKSYKALNKVGIYNTKY